MRQIDVAERECARNERIIGRVELALDPVGPDPVQVVLNCLGVYETAGVKQHASPKQLKGLGKFRRFRKPTDFRDKINRIEKSVGARCASDQEPDGPRVKQHAGVITSIVRRGSKKCRYTSTRRPAIPNAHSRFGSPRTALE